MSEPRPCSVACVCRFADHCSYRSHPLGEPLPHRGYGPQRWLVLDAFIHLLGAPDLNFPTERERGGAQHAEKK